MKPIVVLLLILFLLSGCKTNVNVVDPANLPDLVLLRETTLQIRDDMPPFVVKAYCREDNKDFISDLQIIDRETGRSVGEFCLIDYMGNWDIPKGVPVQYFKIEWIDVDFDGYKDIQIFVCSNGTWNEDYIYFVWDVDTSTFIDDQYGLASLGLPVFDEEKQLVYSMRRGSACDHWYYTYKYIDGVLVAIEEVSDNRLWDYMLDDSIKQKIKAIEPLYDADTTTFSHLMINQLDFDTLEMVVVENKFKLYDISRMGERALLTEHDVNSDLGFLLSGLI